MGLVEGGEGEELDTFMFFCHITEDPRYNERQCLLPNIMLSNRIRCYKGT